MEQNIREIASEIREALAFLDSVDKSWLALDSDQIEGRKENHAGMIVDLEKRQKRLIRLYGSKFGPPAVARKKPVRSWAEANSMRRYLYDSDVNALVFAEAGGVMKFFVKKPSAADYHQYYETAELMKEYCQYTISSLEKLVRARDAIERLQTEYIRAFSSLRDLGDAHRNALYIGDIEEPIEVSYDLPKLESAGCLEDGWLKVPFTYDPGTPFALLVKNSAAGARKTNAAFIRSMMYRIMRAMPLYSYMFTYYDQGGGKNIGSLGALSDVVNYNAYFLNEKLFRHRFQQLELFTTRQEINESLTRFEEYIAGVNKACSEYPHAAAYNQACGDGGAAGRIPQRYVFFENICGAADDVGRIRKMIENSTRCGISLVICADLSESGGSVSAVEQIAAIPGVDVIEIGDEGCNFTFGQADEAEEGTQGERLVYQYVPCCLDSVERGFVSEFAKALNPEVRLETRFEKLFGDAPFWALSGDSEIRFPVAVNLRGELEDLTLGTATYPFGMMCGHSGCGKSTFLHTIISGVIRNYHPLDVQMWLADYKLVEFSQYTVDTPPHIRFIGLSRNKEYSISFLEKICREQTRRQQLFEALHVTSVEDYRRICGKYSMPRLMIIIDEFHVLSDHIKDEPEWKQKLTGIFKEARAVGITMLLSDQTCGVGLRGLEEAAKKQIQNRLAMQTDAEEQKAIFDVSSLEEIPQVQVYEVVMRFVQEIVDSGGVPRVIHTYHRCKTIYASNDVRREIAGRSIAMAREQGVELPPPDIVDIKPKHADLNDIGERIGAYVRASERGIPMYLGTPLSMDKYFSFRLLDTYNENVMCIGKDPARLKSLVYHQLECIRRRYEEYDFYVFADENCDLFVSLESCLLARQKQDPSVKIVTDYGEICRNICAVLSEIRRRAKIKGAKKPLYILWIGLEILAKVLANYSEQRPDYRPDDPAPVRRDAFGGTQADLESLFDELFGEGEAQRGLPEETEDGPQLYNACEDIRRILGEGGTAGVHSIVLYNTVAALRMTKCSRAENFNHRIAFSMSPDDAGDFLSRAALIRDAEGRIIGGDVAVYDGGVRDMKFMPFLLEE